MLKKTLIAIAAIALLAVPATSFGLQLGEKSVPVVMNIDKTVTFWVEDGEIELFPMFESDNYAGQTKVKIFHNFPVLLLAAIAPEGDGIASSYRVAISKHVDPMPFPNEDGTDQRVFPGSAPGGEAFFLGAKLTNVDISQAQHSAGKQLVATIMLTALDSSL